MSANPAASPPPEIHRPSRAREGGWLSVTSIILGCLALILAILPAVIYDERPKWPWDDEEKQAAQKKPLTLETKRFKVTFGGDKDAPQTPAAQPASPTRPWRIAMIVAAVLGMAFAPFAWMRERHRPIAGTAAAMCCVALTWQYIIVGVAVGAGLAILLFFLYHLTA